VRAFRDVLLKNMADYEAYNRNDQYNYSVFLGEFFCSFYWFFIHHVTSVRRYKTINGQIISLNNEQYKKLFIQSEGLL